MGNNHWVGRLGKHLGALCYLIHAGGPGLVCRRNVPKSNPLTASKLGNGDLIIF